MAIEDILFGQVRYLLWAFQISYFADAVYLPLKSEMMEGGDLHSAFLFGEKKEPAFRGLLSRVAYMGLSKAFWHRLQ